MVPHKSNEFLGTSLEIQKSKPPHLIFSRVQIISVLVSIYAWCFSSSKKKCALLQINAV